MAGSRRVVVQFSRKKQEKQKIVDFWWGDACMPADCRPLRLLLLPFKISCHVHCATACMQLLQIYSAIPQYRFKYHYFLYSAAPEVICAHCAPAKCQWFETTEHAGRQNEAYSIQATDHSATICKLTWVVTASLACC
jgi:hypothetical protein